MGTMALGRNARCPGFTRGRGCSPRRTRPLLERYAPAPLRARLSGAHFRFCPENFRFCPENGAGTEGAPKGYDLMAHVDPLIAHRPEFADTQPDLRILESSISKTALARLKKNALPLLVGAGVGVGLTVTVAALTSKKQARFSLFPVPRATLFGNLAKVALIAVGQIGRASCRERV